MSNRWARIGIGFGLAVCFIGFLWLAAYLGRGLT